MGSKISILSDDIVNIIVYVCAGFVSIKLNRGVLQVFVAALSR